MAKHAPTAVSSFPAGHSALGFHSWGLRLLALVHFVCPLLFFTNLTRNPYFTQIALLYLLLSFVGLVWVAGCLKTGEVQVPALGLEKPLLVFLAVALVSFVMSWVNHPALREGIVYEGIRVWVFTLVNSVWALYLPVLFVSPLSKETKIPSIWPDILFALGWGLLWFGFSSMKSRVDSQLIWDPYGAVLWAGGAAYVMVRTRKGDARSFFHVVFAVTLLAGLYGLIQYAGRDVIWSSLVIPYGGRPVSTFGNPNFLSSYLLLVCPLAVTFALSSRGANAKGYGFVAVVAALSILATLTRSTYVGLLAAFFMLGVLLYRREHRSLVFKFALAALAVVILVLVFPGTPVSKIQSPLARFTEIFEAMRTGESYGPWHQRILIWSSAWDMVRERPFFGKGWGGFELFYPFYQGAYLFNPMFAQWRTHANNAHNVLMEIWSQVGTIGMGAAVLLFATMVTQGIKIVREKIQGPMQLITAGLLAGWLGVVVDNFFGNVSIFFAMPAFLFWWFIGSLYNEANGVKVRLRSAHSMVARGTLIGLALIFVFSSVYYFRRWRQEIDYFEGFKMAKSNRIPESIKALENAHAWFPREVNTNYELGNSYARRAKIRQSSGLAEQGQKDVEKAAWAYEEALRANPGYDEIYFNLGVTQFQLGRDEEGLKNLRTAILINPLLHSAYGALTSHFVNNTRWSDAREVLEQGVRAFPRDRDQWTNLAFVASQMGDNTRSLEASRRAVQLDPSHNPAWQNFTAVASKLNVRDPLLELPALMERMSAHINQNDFSRAQPVAKRLVELLPDNLDIGLSYANILFYLGERSASIDEYKRLIKIAPHFSPAHLNLARVYMDKVNIPLARFHLEKVLSVNPDDADAKQLLESIRAGS